MTAAEAPLPSFVEGELAARKIRLLHHVRLLLGLTPILAMLALGPNATLLRILLVFTLLATVTDLVVNQWLRGGISMWTELPRTIDLPPASAAGFDEPVAQASVPVRIAVPRGAGSAGRFVYGLTSITKLWSDRLIDGAVPVVAERRGRLATVSFEVETGGVFMHAHTVLGFVFTPVQPILVVPAATRDEAGRAAYRACSAAATAELEIVHDYNYAQVLTVDLVRKGFGYHEVPITYAFRSTGRSFIRLGTYLRRCVPAVWHLVNRPPRSAAATPSQLSIPTPTGGTPHVHTP